MSPYPNELERRTFLLGLGVLAGAGLSAGALTASPAQATDRLSPRVPDWRRALADQYLPTGTPFDTRGLQDGLEVWEAATGGYLVVESSQQSVLEASPTALSPYRALDGDLAYMGPGQYYRTRGSLSTEIFTGKTSPARELQAMAPDTAQFFRETLVRETTVSSPLTNMGTVTPFAAAPAELPRLKSGDAKSRVPNYSYITGSRVYPNHSGICGWVAGSIVTRYWHARSSARKLLPSKYRSGTNMTSSPNFATYLQGKSGNSSWARDVKDRLNWNAKNQGVKYASSWALGKINAMSDIRKGYPVIIFGKIPTGNKKTGAHAVVAYGETKGGFFITHYGWSNHTNIILNSGLAGSNTKFRLT